MMRLGIFLLALLTGGTSWAERYECTPAMLVEKSDLIGTGILVDVSRTESNKTVCCEGTLRLDELLKGTNSLVKVTWSFSIPPIEESQDYTSLEGKQLLWFLQRSGDGLSWEPLMDGVQNTSRTAEFRAIVGAGLSALQARKEPEQTQEERERKWSVWVQARQMSATHEAFIFTVGTDTNGVPIQQVEWLYRAADLKETQCPLWAGSRVTIGREEGGAVRVQCDKTALPDEKKWHEFILKGNVVSGWLNREAVIKVRMIDWKKHTPNAPAPEPLRAQKQVRSVTGVLSHFPSDVRTAQAWYWHNFMVGGVPVQPTTAVPETELLKHVGKKVSVSGFWNPGIVWKPTEEERNTQMPVNPDKDAPVIRGDGIIVEKLEVLTE
jgi:hypothetical protein